MSSSVRNFHDALEDITIVPAQLFGSPPRDYLREYVATGITLGERTAERPIELDVPILLGGITEIYSDLSKRSALIHGAGGFSTVVDCGWLGILDSEKALASEVGAKTMIEFGVGRLGAVASIYSGSDAAVLSLVHGGSGSMNSPAGSIILPKNLAPEINELLQLDSENPVINPPRLLDMDTPRDINKLVSLIREITVHEIPVLIKIGSGNIYNDIRIAVNAKPDGIIFDCLFDEQSKLGLPGIGCLAPMAAALKDSKADSAGVKLIFSGDLQTGSDIFKVLAFGASGVLISKAALLEAGLISEKETPKPEAAGAEISKYLNSTLAELKALTAWTGHESISDISADNLRALNYDTAAATGLKLIGYDKILTMWEH